MKTIIKKHWIKLMPVVIIIACVFVYFFFFSAKIPVYPVFTLNQGNNDEAVQLTGTTFDLNLQKIFAEPDKTVSEIYVEKNQEVTKGTALFKYDTTAVEIAMKKNELKIQQIQNSIQNNKNKDNSALQLDLKREKTKYEQNKNVYNHSIYYSDYDGIVKNITTGKEKEIPFMEIYGGNGMNVSMDVPESELEKIHEEDEVYFMTYDFSKSYQGKIVSKDIYPSKIESNISYYRVVAWIADSQDVSVGTELQVSFPAKEVSSIWLENAYIREENGKKYVLKSDNHGRLKKMYVRTGQSRYGMSTEILEGITDSDYIAFPHGKHVKEGAKVKKEGEESEQS